jgi:inhibitor of KinA
MNYKIFPLGDNALTVDFGNEISVALNNRALKLNDFFKNEPFPGLIETVPAYSSLTIFYDVFTVQKNFTGNRTAFAKVSNHVETALEKLNTLAERPFRLMRIPVCFDDDFALDLNFISSENALSRMKIIEIFLGKTYRVFLIGFLPGFAYMGELDERIAAPRKTAPRLKVPAGSVGIAGKQTGIYSLESPGGWQIIGRTPLQLFTPKQENPTYLQAGDAIEFYEIDRGTFSKIKLENEK